MDSSAATIGNFDGIHRGHQLVVHTLIELSKETGLRPLVVTFDRHPLSIIDPERTPKALMLPEDKCVRLKQLGASHIMLPFDDELRSLSSEEFMHLLRDDYGVRLLLLGHDNRFGHDRASTFTDYIEYGGRLGIRIEQAPAIPGISSSVIRQMLLRGDTEGASRALGYEYAIRGKVTHGAEIGRTIGFPTANLLPDERLLIPTEGVYTGRANLPDGKSYPAMINIGHRPTIGEHLAPTIEAHLDGFSGDLYGSVIQISFAHRIRGERKMHSIDELRAQLQSDLNTLRKQQPC